MAAQIRVRRGTAAQWTSANPTLADGEVGVETDTSKIKVGDGTTAWTSLAYQSAPSDFIDISTIEKGGIVVGTSSGNTTVLPVGADGTVLGVDANDPTTVGWVDFELGALSGTIITSPQAGDLLRFDGTNWVNGIQALIDNRDALTALVWGDSAGYIARGVGTPTVYKWTFPTDTVTTTTNAPASVNNAGFANPSVAGYFSQGVYKLDFPTEGMRTTTSPPDWLNLNAAFSNSSVAGYFSRAGTSSCSLFQYTTVYKFVFPIDTVSTSTSLPAAPQEGAGFANPSVAGYFSRGSSGTTVYKWAFPADTVTTTTAAPAGMRNHAGFANPSVAGYFSRGNSTTTVYKWAFPADTVTTTTAAPANMVGHAGFANPSVAGYFSQASANTTVYKWAFPADTVTTTTAAPASLYSIGSFSNGY